MNLFKKIVKIQRILKTISFILPAILFFSGFVFLSAFFANFVVNVQNVDVTLGSLESSNAEFAVSFDPSFTTGPGDETYHIAPSSLCNQNQYNVYGNCIDPVPNLCPYLSLQPKNEEVTEIGFTQNQFNLQATGQLNNPDDITDTWNLLVNSPCFEGECPTNYDELQNGDSLPQSQKGQTFKCNLSVETNDIPESVRNYLKQNTAYADTLLDTIEVSAVLTGELTGCTVDCFSNVLFLPGLEASRLYKTRTDGSEDQLWEPNGNSDVVDLYLNTDGTSINSGIYTRDIIKETNTPIPTGALGQNIYKSFSDAMDQLVTNHKIKEWKEYAYDWRQDVDNIINNGTKYQSGTVSLIDTLQSLVGPASKDGKVTIIAHSNGGLLAKALLKKLQDDKTAGINNLIDNVDVLILVGVPQIGTAKAVPAILHGYDQSILGGFLLNESYARELGKNMPGAYGLLPSKEYINRVSASPVTFVSSIFDLVTTKLVQTFGDAIDSYVEYKDFLFGAEGRVNPPLIETNLPISLLPTLFSQAENLHDSIDAFIPPASLRVIEVAGWGIDTVASFEYYPRLSCSGSLSSCTSVLDERPRFTSDGDKTVVVSSAHYMNFLGSAERYWVDLPTHNKQLLLARRNRQHKDILEVDSLNNLIKSVIKKEGVVFDSVLKSSEPTDTSNRLRLSIHSPVTLDAYDLSGNHTGKICPPNSDFCYVEETIPNSSYLEFGEGKYINLPEDQMLEIKLQGTDIGTFTYESEKVLPDGTSTISSFIDIPVTTQTQAEATLNQSGTPELALDVTGDGIIDFTLTPSSTFDPITYLQIMKATIDSLDLNQARIKAFGKRVDNIIKSIQKGKIDKAKLKIEQFKKTLTIHPKEKDNDKKERERENEQENEREHKEDNKPKQLTPADAQLLLDMLNKLLVNLN